jgi:hypothetical protein
MASVQVPAQFLEEAPSGQFNLSIIQVVVTVYRSNTRVPPRFFKWLMAPGMHYARFRPSVLNEHVETASTQTCSQEATSLLC